MNKYSLHDDSYDSTHSVIMPTAFYLPRKTKKDKRVGFGMNQFSSSHNLHYHEKNLIKKMYKEEVAKQLTKFDLKTPLRIEIVFFAGTNRRYDLDNRCVMHSKYFADSLVELGYIEDDTCKYIPKINYRYGGFDKGNQRVEIYCFEI